MKFFPGDIVKREFIHVHDGYTTLRDEPSSRKFVSVSELRGNETAIVIATSYEWSSGRVFALLLCKQGMGWTDESLLSLVSR